MTVLLDANVLIALVVAEHVHHEAAERWLDAVPASIATCPITEGSLVRLLIREGQSAETARTVLGHLARDPRHEFWPDDLPYAAVPFAGVIGHRQVTDAYLAELARVKRGRLATFDKGMAGHYPDIVDLVPST